jgi:hypothetical protein
MEPSFLGEYLPSPPLTPMEDSGSSFSSMLERLLFGAVVVCGLWFVCGCGEHEERKNRVERSRGRRGVES